MGIKMFADQARTEFRNVMEVFTELAAKWNDPSISAGAKDALMAGAQAAGLFSQELADATGTQDEYAQAVQATTEAQNQFNDVEKRDAAQAAAGIYRRNYFIGLLERFATVSKVQLSIDKSSGYSQRENARTMETLERKYKALEVSVMQLAVSLGDSGLIGILKALTDAGTGAIKMFGGMDKGAQDFILATLSVFVAVKTTMSMLKMFGITFGLVTAAEKAAAVATLAMAEATVVETAAVNAATVASKAWVLSNSILLGIAAIIGGIALAWGAVAREQERSAKFIETTKGDIKTLEEQKKGLQELSAEYETLKTKQDALTATADEKLRLLEVQKELVSLYGVSITGINSEGEAYSDSLPAILLRNQALQDEIDLKQKSLEIEVRSKDVKNVENIRKASLSIEKLTKKKVEAQEEYEKMLSAKATKTPYTFIDEYGIPTEVGAESHWLEILLSQRSSYLLALDQKLEKERTLFKDSSAERQQVLQNDADAMIKQLQDNGVKVSDTARAFAREFAKALGGKYETPTGEKATYDIQKQELTEFINYLNSPEVDGAFTKFSDDYKKAVSEGDTQGIINASNSIKGLTDKLVEAHPYMLSTASIVSKMFPPTIKQGINGFSLSTEQLTEDLKEQNKFIDETQSSLKSLADMYYQVANGQELNSNQMLDLIQNYPDVLKFMDSEGNLMVSQQDLLKNLFELKKQDAILTQTTARDNARVILESLEAQRVAYLNYYKAISTEFRPISSEEVAKLVGFDKTSYENALKAAAEAQAKIKALEGLTFETYKGGKGKDENKQLQEALKLLEYKYSIIEQTTESMEKELEELKKINNVYSMNADERMNITKKIYDAEKALREKKIDDEKKYNDDRLKNSTDWINQEKEFGRLSAEATIAAWNRVRDNQKNNIEAIKAATKGMFDAYKDLLSEQMESIDESYRDQIDMIERESESKKKAQQEIIKGIEDELKLLDRKEDKYDYNQKKSELLEQRRYHEMRTGEEHRKAIEDIDKQLDELEHDRDVELNKQKLEDEKQAAEDEIDIIEKLAKEEKKKWETAYKDIQKAFDKHGMNIVAIAATMSKQAFEEWEKNYIVRMQEALKSGDIKGFTEVATESEASMERMQIYQNASTILDLKKQYEVGGDKSAADRAKAYYDELEKLSPGVADQLHKMNYKQTEEYLKELPKMHDGGETLSYGAVYMKPGELVFPPTLSTDLKGLMSMLQIMKPGQQISNQSTDNKRIVNINGPLFNSEKTMFEDDTDERSFARELQRAVLAIG